MFSRPNVQYDRKIRYLDYYENGQRCQGAGFIKLERRDELCNISLQISGLYRRDRFTRPFLLIGEEGEKELCKLQIAEGGIKTYFEGLNCNNLGGQGIRYDQLLGVRIPVADGKEIRCIWRNMPEKSEEMQEFTTQEQMQEPTTQEELQEFVPQETAQKIMGEAVPGKSEETAQKTSWVKARAMAREAAEKTTKKHQQVNTYSNNDQAEFMEDKWEQLWMIYPHVHPFSDDREFLSVSPSDFVLLNRQSYKLVNNSFLLHGYYSFRHLILMRGDNRGQAKFYIGVPGNLYERDKKSAIMFGFESFECAKEPAAEGDFGYYLIPVEL